MGSAGESIRAPYRDSSRDILDDAEGGRRGKRSQSGKRVGSGWEVRSQSGKRVGSGWEAVSKWVGSDLKVGRG